MGTSQRVLSPVISPNYQKEKVMKKTFQIILLVALGIGVIIGGYELLLGDFDDTTVKVLTTILAVGGYSLTGIACAALYEKKKYRGVSIPGIIFSVAAIAISCFIIWGGFEDFDQEWVWKSFFITMIGSGALAQASLLLNITLGKVHKSVSIILIITLVLAAVVSTMLIAFILFPETFMDLAEDNPDFIEYYFRFAGFFFLANVGGMAAVPIVNWRTSKLIE